MTKTVIIAGDQVCEFVIPQIDSYATGIIHPDYEAHLERSRQQPRVGVIREYKKGKGFTLFSVNFFQDMKNVSNWAKGNKYLTPDLIKYMTTLGLSAEKFLKDFHKTNKISVSLEEWNDKHINAYTREKLKTPLKRKPPVRAVKEGAPGKSATVKKTTKKPSKKKEASTPSPASDMVAQALDNIKTGKGKKN